MIRKAIMWLFDKAECLKFKRLVQKYAKRIISLSDAELLAVHQTLWESDSAGVVRMIIVEKELKRRNLK